MLLFPDHVLVVLGVLNIKPENVNRDILLIEPLLNTPDVVGADIVPSALVIAQRPMRRELDCSGQLRVLTEDLVRRGSRKEKDVKNTRLGDPMGFSRLLSGVGDIDPGFGSDCDEDGDGRICRVCVD